MSMIFVSFERAYQYAILVTI